MARLPKVGVDYFPHLVGARDGKTLYILKSKFGNDGYAFWYQLLEILGSEKDLCYACDKSANWLYLTATTGVDEEKAEQILDILADLEAIDPDLWNQDKTIWCQDFVNLLEPIYRKRRQLTPQKPLLKSEVEAIKDQVDAVAPIEQNVVHDDPVKDAMIEEEPSDSFVQEDLKESYQKWIRYKKERGKPYKSVSSRQACYEQLVNYSHGDPSVAKEIITKSIAMNYDGFFPSDKVPKFGGQSSDYVPEHLVNANSTLAKDTNISTI